MIIEANEKMQAIQKEELPSVYVDRIIELHNSDMWKESTLQKEQQNEHYQQIDKTKEVEMSVWLHIAYSNPNILAII